VGEVLKRSRAGKFLGYYLRWYEGGKRRIIASKQSTYAEARRMLQAIEGRIARGLAGLDEPSARPQVLTLAELSNRFLSEYSRPRLKDPGEYRIHARKALRRVLPFFGKHPVDGIRPLDVAKLRDSLSKQFAPNSVRSTLSFLRTLYSWAVRLELVAKNPCRGIELPKARDLLEYLSKDEVRRLLTYTSEQAPAIYPMIATAIYTGLRKGELFGLRWRNVDFSGRRLDIERSYRTTPKSGKPRHLRLPSTLLPILKEWQTRCPATPETLVFPVVRRHGRAGLGRSQEMLNLPALLDAAGCQRLERPWHALRHTFASHFIMAGGNILALQKILGHADLRMTLMYAHLAPDFLGDEMDRLKF
jgi:integrase